MGVDASSSSTGATLIDNDKLIASLIWQPTNKAADPSERLFDFYQWIGDQLYLYRPSLVVVSVTSFSRSHNTTRVLARYEGASIIAARMYSCEVIEARDSQARALVLSKGNVSKEEAYKEVLQMEPKFDWLPFSKGGNDQADAFVFAKAGPQLRP